MGTTKPKLVKALAKTVVLYPAYVMLAWIIGQKGSALWVEDVKALWGELRK